MHCTWAEGAHRRGTPARRQRDERGSSAVEFALVVPVLLLLVFGIINFGLVMAQKASLSNAARAGARYATVNAYTGTRTCANVVDKVRANAPTIGIADTAAGRQSVGVTVKLTRAADGNVSTICNAPVGGTTSASTSPCQNLTNGSPSTPDTLTIDVTYTTKSFLAVPGVGKTFALGSSSSFLCEYYK
jgi:Flp pilus assembly protein TadG